jgi:hypothetical protein
MTADNGSTSPIDYTNEVWKDIPGYEGYYQVSDMGRVRSLERVIISTTGQRVPVQERILKGTEHKSGYFIVGLAKNGIKTRTIHSLVALAFVGERPERNDIHHKNGNKKDNRLNNLVYISCYEHNAGKNQVNSKWEPGQIRHCIELYMQEKYTVGEIAEKTGLSPSTVRSVKDNRRWKIVGRPDGFFDINTDAKHVRGTRCHSAKLNPEKVREVRRLWGTGEYNYSSLGRMYGLSPSSIKKIVTRKTWKHVD